MKVFSTPLPMPETGLFYDVTLLITHYNRSHSLKRLLEAFEALGCRFGQIVVSDDGSKPEHIEKLVAYQSEHAFKLVTTPKNRGLGNNINKGQDAAETEFVLYVQEDFVPRPLFPKKFAFALDYLRKHPETDMARFYAYFRYPYLKPIGEGFSKMGFSIFKPGYRKFYMYSDHPHLRRSSFPDKFGRYQEGISGDQTEYRMMMSFLKQKGVAIYYDDFKGLFDQVNSSNEPSTMHRHRLRESDRFALRIARHLYRHVKFNFDFIR